MSLKGRGQGVDLGSSSLSLILSIIFCFFPLEFPYDPLNLFPFFVFLSPLPHKSISDTAGAAHAGDNDEYLAEQFRAADVRCVIIIRRVIAPHHCIAVKLSDSMEIEVSCSTHDAETKGNRIDLDSIRVKRKTLQNLLADCQRALELLELPGDENGGEQSESPEEEEEEESDREEPSASDPGDPEADKFYDLIKSRVECNDFREKIELAQVSVPQVLAEDSSSWDVVSEDDLWDEECVGQTEDDYVVVREEDIADGIACFMATYLSSLKQTKDISPDQLQKALSTMFSVKKRKGKLRKAWEGSKVIYNVASWSATAIGIYQNPMILSIASKAFWMSCQAISKLV